jgi:hypothetical protein
MSGDGFGRKLSRGVLSFCPEMYIEELNRSENN